MATWQVQQAKAHFSELLDEADNQGPQIITRHGVERSVVLSIGEYHALKGKKRDFIEHLLGGPKFDELDITRDPDTGRDVTFE